MGMERSAKQTSAISSVSVAGLGMDAFHESGIKKELSASYTVEASLVMAVALFFIAALLNGVFEVHGRITGRFILQEAMENCLYREENSLRGTGKTSEELAGKAQQHLRGFFRCGDAKLTVQTGGKRLEGMVTCGAKTQIEICTVDPEYSIRLLTALDAGIKTVGQGTAGD